MIPGRIEQPPARRLGVSPLVIVEHDPGEVAQLAIPLALRQQEPVERLAQASSQGRHGGTAAACRTKPTSPQPRPACSQINRIRR